jgi:hypothetical protein
MPLFDYFRAPAADAVRQHMEADATSPLATFDGADFRNIDPTVVLGQLIAFATGRPWSPSLTGDTLIWPADPCDHEGPWVTVLADETRDALATIPAAQLPNLAERWSAIDELTADPDSLRPVIERFTALAAEARTHDESLFCWMSL